MMDPAEAARKKRRHRNERIVAALIVLAVAALTAATVYWHRSQEQAVLRDARYIPKVAVITPEIELLREYVRIDTTTPQGVAAGARWLAAQLAKFGVRAELIESTDGRLNVYARIKGREAGGGLLLFNHIDVVPPGDGWRKPPFAGEIELNQMYGRGVIDMKSLAITQLLAFGAVARSGRVPGHDLVFLATAEEEQGSRNGLRWLLEHRPDVIGGIHYGITEGGLTEVMTETMTYFGIEVGGKQLVEVTLAAPDEESLRQARFVLQRYVVRREPDRVLPEVRRHFRDIAPTRVSARPYLADIDRTIAQGDFWRLPYSYREFMTDSLWLAAPSKGDRDWRMFVRMVNLPETDPDARIEWLRGQVAKFGVTIAEIHEKQGPVPMSSSDTPLFRILAAEARQQYGVDAGVQILYRSQSDSRFLRPLGIVCYGVSPFAVDYFQSLSIHGRDERVRLDWFGQGVEYMKRVVQTWAFTTPR